LNCDCKLSWLPDFLESLSDTGSTRTTCATPANLADREISTLSENLFTCECDASSMLNSSTIYCVKYAHTLESMDAPIVCGWNEAKIPPGIVQQVLYQQTWQATLLEAAPLALCLHVALI